MHPRDSEYDLLIAGAGPVGCVIAERAASQLGWRVLLVEQRGHIAGMCYDGLHTSGVFIHRYGPHYFRTNNSALIEYLSQFTDWIDSNYIVKSYVNGRLHPFPINLTTLEMFFHRSFTASSAEQFLDTLRVKIDEPHNAEEYVLSRIGHELYEAFYLHYTLKAWGKHPRDLHPSVVGRIPIRFNRDERYVDHAFQKTPARGFTAMFAAMLDHPNIEVQLNTSYKDAAKEAHPRRATVFSGPVDAYFDYRFGKLPWRSTAFKFEYFDQGLKQPCVQINYPTQHAYTRATEIKHLTRQRHPGTVVAYEYPGTDGDPLYPIPTDENDRLYRAYAELAQRETQDKQVYFCGRLAQYIYINSDQAMERALRTFQQIQADCAGV